MSRLKSVVSSSEKVIDVFYEMVRESLGTSGSVCCIAAGDEEEEVYVKDVTEILKCLDVQHPAGVYVVKLCRGHKDLYSCGVKSMLFLMGQLCKRVRQLVEQGVPLFYMEELLTEAIEDCIESLGAVSVPVTLCSTSGIRSAALSTPQSASPAPTSPAPTSTSPTSPAALRSGHQLDHLVAKSASHCPDGERFKLLARDSETNRNESVMSSVEGDEFETECCSQAPIVQMKVSHCENGTALDSLQKFHGGDRVKSEVREIDQTNTSSSVTQQTDATTTSAKLDSAFRLPSTQRFRNLIQAGQLSAKNINGILLQRKTPPASAALHRRVMQSSRHLHCSDDVTQDKAVSRPEPNMSSRSHASRHLHSEQGVLENLQADSLKMTHKRQSVEALLRTGQSPVAPSARRSVVLPEEAEVLSHSCDEMMSWAKEMIRCQLLHGKLSKLDVKLIHTSCVSGQRGSHRLVQGLVLQADTDVMEVLCRRDSATVLLVNGDVTAEYRHKGHKDTLAAKQVLQGQDFPHQQQHGWHGQVLHLLKRLDVHVVLVRGVADADLTHQALAAGIAVIDRVPYHALQVLQAACRVDFVTYVLDAHEGNISAGVTLTAVLEDWCGGLRSDRQHLVITVPVFLQTLVIRDPTAAGRQMLEEEFWHCMARLAQAAEDGRVLSGGGATEQWCAHQLRHNIRDQGQVKVKWSQELALYRPVVRSALADTFLSFSSAVRRNRQQAGHRTDSEQLPADGEQIHAVGEQIPSDREQVCKVCTEKLQLPCRASPHCGRKLNSSVSSTSCVSPADRQKQGLKKNLQLKPASQSLGERGSLDFSCSCSSCAGEAGSDVGGDAAVCDNYSSKVNGWRLAVDCVLMVMRMDSLIVTGVDQQSQPSHSVLL